MKVPSLLILAALLCTPFAGAQSPATSTEKKRNAAIGSQMETFRSADGKTFHNVRITRIDDGGVSILHATGTARLRYENLSENHRLHFGLTQEDSLLTYQREAERKATYEKAVAELQEQRAAAAAESHKAALEREATRPASPTLILASTQTTSPIPENPQVNAATAFFPNRSRSFRSFSGTRFFPHFRRGFSSHRGFTIRRNFSSRGFRHSSGFSHRSPRFGVIFR